MKNKDKEETENKNENEEKRWINSIKIPLPKNQNQNQQPTIIPVLQLVGLKSSTRTIFVRNSGSINVHSKTKKIL